MKKGWVTLVYNTLKKFSTEGAQSLTWVALRPYVIKIIQSLIIKVIGPVGWVAKLVPMIVKTFVKPWFNLVIRKIKKKQRAKQGAKEAQETRDVSVDNVDDIYDSMQ